MECCNFKDWREVFFKKVNYTILNVNLGHDHDYYTFCDIYNIISEDDLNNWVLFRVKKDKIIIIRMINLLKH